MEVGVSEFVFFRSERSQKLIINERKIERFREIVREATEQCGGNRVPTITFLESKIPLPSDGVSYVFHTEDTESKPISHIIKKFFSSQELQSNSSESDFLETRKNDEICTKTADQSEPYDLYGERGSQGLSANIEVISCFLNLFVGPEGGFSPSEILFFQENNVEKIHLGARILRTETT